MTGMPWPGDELVWRVSNSVDRDAFVQSGQMSVHDLQSVLAVTGRQLSDYSSILDFGCGCGRIMLWLEGLAGSAALHGTDIDERAIAWCQGNIPFARFQVNQTLPPLPHDDASFDLVFSNSVFTHIDEKHQDQWLTELRRVTRPGGHLLLSVHGEQAFLTYEENLRSAGRSADVIREELGRNGISFLENDAFVGGPFPDCYHSTFHAPWYLFEHWGRFFDIVALVPKGSLSFQDILLLQRPDGDAEGGKPRRPIEVLRDERSPESSPEPGAGPTGEWPGARHQALVAPSSRYRWVPGRVRWAAGRVRRYWSGDVSPATLKAIRKHTTLGGVPLTESTARLWEALRAHGDRVSRLEADVWKALGERPPPE